LIVVISEISNWWVFEWGPITTRSRRWYIM